MENKEIDQKSKSWTKTILKVASFVAIIIATGYAYLDTFGVVEAPEEVKELAKKADSLMTEKADTLIIDTIK